MVKFLGLLLALLAVWETALAEEPYAWNRVIPIKRPAHPNGKLVLFDVSHGGTQGAADWVIDGGFSDFADALVAEGFIVEEYRGVDKNKDGVITMVDDRVPTGAGNEAVITFEAIRRADVLVLAETNRPFRQDEYAALKRFVDSGKGIYFIADHYNADRNMDTWDATEVFNGYNRSDLPVYRMASPYGDLRNPRNASAGWLASNFGLRFRFNAVDWKSGASDIVEPSKVEGLTKGVGPVLVAAGSTLAIVDPGKAKGLVYFSNSDSPVGWNSAVDAGLYFGGPDEGPVVAISKPSAGKAAFIGDSSPIEDKTPRYRREDNGKSKSAHAGWSSPGNAATLSVNLVKWLATPESYVGFGGGQHPPGFKTPEPMAATEVTDPEGGGVWRKPKGGYDPWDPGTYANGSYGAPYAAGPGSGSRKQQPSSTGSSSASTRSTISVTAALARDGQRVTVKGRISGPLNTQYGLVLADPDQPGKTLAVQIPARLREQYSPALNPGITGKVVLITGTRASYMSQPGLKGVSEIVIAP